MNIMHPSISGVVSESCIIGYVAPIFCRSRRTHVRYFFDTWPLRYFADTRQYMLDTPQVLNVSKAYLGHNQDNKVKEKENLALNEEFCDSSTC